MKLPSSPPLLPRLLLLLSSCCLAVLVYGSEDLFNGKDLQGWIVRSGTADFRVEDGVIIGTTVPRSPNSFLCTQKQFRDFELEVEVLCDPGLNSGIQVRSQIATEGTKVTNIKDPNNPRTIELTADRVYGYQVEISRQSSGRCGGIYDEARRFVFLDEPGNKPGAKKAFRDGEWNHYRIRCVGDRLQTWVNGILCADVQDDLNAEGIIGLQVHGNVSVTGRVSRKPYEKHEVRFRHIRLREISDRQKESKPNIIVIFADDVGYGDLSCYGATHVQTPNLDQLAQEGRRFTDAHTASAVCSPSRYALMTGRYPVRHGNLWSPIFLRVPLVIDSDRTTIADLAKRAGYSTNCLGKWHLGFGQKQPTDWNAPLKPGPLELGFDTYFGIPVVNSHPPFVWVHDHRVVGWTADDPFVYGTSAKTKRYDEKFGIDQIGGAETAHELYDDEAVGETLARMATAWISQQSEQDQPFFLYLATHNIHHPFTPAKRFQNTSQAGPYGDFIHELDWIVGEVMEQLKTSDIENETLLIFTSDNGGMLNRGGQEAWRRGHRLNGPLLGFKFDAWEGGHRIPFIARWPGHIPSGSESSALISNIDLMATLAAVTDQKLESDEGPDSFNLLPALTGSETIHVRDHLLIAPARKTHLSLREADWMYISDQGGGGFAAKKEGDHAFGGPAAHRFTGHANSDIENGEIRPDAPSSQLYNLATDPLQKQNVVREHPKVAMRLETKIQEIRDKATAPHAAR